MYNHSKEILDKHFQKKEQLTLSSNDFLESKLKIAEVHYNNLVTMYNTTCETFGNTSEEAQLLLNVIDKQVKRINLLKNYNDFTK